MKTENEENLEKVRKEGVRMRGQGEGGRKEGKEIRKEEGWRMSIFHLFLSFSSFFCKNSLLSFFPYFRLSSSTFLYISSFLPHLPPFLLLVFPIFLSSFPSLLPLFLLSFLLSFYLFPSSLFLYIFSLHFLLFLCIHPLFSFLTSSYSPVCFSTFPFLPSLLPLLFLMLPLFLSSFPSSLCLPPLLLATLPLVLFFSLSPSFLSLLPVLSSCFLHISVFPSFLPPPPLPRHISQEGFVLSVRPPLLVFPFISQNLNMVGV